MHANAIAHPLLGLNPHAQPFQPPENMSFDRTLNSDELTKINSSHISDSENSRYSALDSLDPELEYSRFRDRIFNSSTLSNLKEAEREEDAHPKYFMAQESSDSSPYETTVDYEEDEDSDMRVFSREFSRTLHVVPFVHRYDILGSDTLVDLLQIERQFDNQPRCFSPYFQAMNKEENPEETGDLEEVETLCEPNLTPRRNDTANDSEIAYFISIG